MKVIQSAQAEQDRWEIVHYLSTVANADVALRFTDSFDDLCSLLSEFDGIGPEPRFETVENLHCRTITGFPGYQAFYTIDTDQIIIRRVANGRRDLPALFELENDGSI